MERIVFSPDAVCRELAASTNMLRWAGVTSVSLDISGSGWSGSFELAIGEAKPVRESINPIGYRSVDGLLVEVPQEAVVVTRLSEKARAAVVAALGNIQIGDRIEWSYGSREAFRHQPDKIVWPLSERIAGLREKIADIEVEIARLQALGDV